MTFATDYQQGDAYDRFLKGLASMETTEAALKVTTRPVIISHTGLDTQLGSNPPMAGMMRPSRALGAAHLIVLVQFLNSALLP